VIDEWAPPAPVLQIGTICNKALPQGAGQGHLGYNDRMLKQRTIKSLVKTTGVGDNKNILLELNIEQTRHNEIQILGNGEWTIALDDGPVLELPHWQMAYEAAGTQGASFILLYVVTPLFIGDAARRLKPDESMLRAVRLGLCRRS